MEKVIGEEEGKEREDRREKYMSKESTVFVIVLCGENPFLFQV
jgi:hypothetical protein